jgi:hypothetical protein
MLLLDLLEVTQIDPATGLPYRVKNNLKDSGIDELPANITYGTYKNHKFFMAGVRDKDGHRSYRRFPIPDNASKEEVRKILNQTMEWQQQNHLFIASKKSPKTIRTAHGSSNPYEVATATALTNKHDSPGIRFYTDRRSLRDKWGYRAWVTDANKQQHSKMFPIKDLDNPRDVENAFRKAKAWYEEHRVETKYSKMTGVVYRPNTDRWRAIFSSDQDDESTTPVTISFSVKKEGWDEAWRKACQARFHFMGGKQKMPDLNKPPSKEDVMAALENTRNNKKSTD